MGRTRILLADDHTIVRQGLRKLLEERPDWEVIAEAGDGREAVRLAEQHKPDVAILDVAMPLLNGIEATRQITKRVPVTRVSEIVNRRPSITADTVLGFARYFSTTAEFWVNLQSAYDLDVATRASIPQLSAPRQPNS